MICIKFKTEEQLKKEGYYNDYTAQNTLVEDLGDYWENEQKYLDWENFYHTDFREDKKMYCIFKDDFGKICTKSNSDFDHYMKYLNELMWGIEEIYNSEDHPEYFL